MTNHLPLPSSTHSLSAQQAALWFLARLRPDEVCYHIAFGCRSLGELNFPALRDALCRLVGRHEVLHSTFADEQGVPMAVIRDGLCPEVAWFDLRGQSPTRREQALEAFYSTPFDLSRGPCLRLGIFQCTEQEHLWLLCTHHIIADFTTLALIMQELEALYIIEIGGYADSALKERPSFKQFIAHERRYLAGAEALTAKAYWSAMLAEPPPPLTWLGAVGRVQRGGASVFFSLEARLSEKVRQFSRHGNVSVFTTLLAAWAVLVGQRTRTQDLIVGAPISLRDKDFAATLGCLFTMVPLRLKLDSRSFRALTATARGMITAALEHRLYPFVNIIEALPVERDGLCNPLLQTTVNMPGSSLAPRLSSLMLGADDLRIPWANMELAPYALRQQEGQVDLALEFADSGSRLPCVIKGQAGLFCASDLTELAGEFAALLEALIDAPDQPVAIATSDGATAAKPLFERINSQALLTPAPDDLVSRIDRWAKSAGDEPAISEQGQAMTYRILCRQSVAIARQLICAGVAAGDRVGLGLAPSALALTAMLAIMRAGAAYVPLEPINPPERIKQMASIAGVRRIVISSEQDPEKFQGLNCELLIIHGGDLSDQDASAINLATPPALAYTLFTSGSTGEPKGIDVLQRNVTAFLDAMHEALALPPGQIWSWCHAASFDLSVWEIWGCLCGGGQLVVIPPDMRSRPDRLLACIRRFNVQIFSQTPSGLRRLLPELARSTTPLPVRYLVVSGEPLPGPVAAPFLTGRTRMWNLYGPAETTVFAMIEEVSAELTGQPILPIGRPLRFATVALLDAQLQPVALGASGEICIGGLGVGAGYVGQPALTAERFITDPFAANGSTMYRTGDRGVWDGERMHYLGRIDQQVKLNGYRIEIGEIECAAGRHPAIAEAVALLECAGESGPQLTLVFVPKLATAKVSPADLRNFLEDRLPYYMLPGRYISTAELPRNGHNKLDRSQLSRQLENGYFSSPDAGESGAPGAKPDLAAALKAIWCSVLGRGDVSIDDVFFDIGGNSLSLMQVHAKLQALPGCGRLQPADLFRFPTIRSLSARGATACGGTSAQPAKPSRAAPLAYRGLAARRKRARRKNA